MRFDALDTPISSFRSTFITCGGVVVAVTGEANDFEDKDMVFSAEVVGVTVTVEKFKVESI